MPRVKDQQRIGQQKGQHVKCKSDIDHGGPMTRRKDMQTDKADAERAAVHARMHTQRCDA
eukprot:8120741-Karenia_brevis.AAC.1